jgi:hypothetical protein
LTIGTDYVYLPPFRMPRCPGAMTLFLPESHSVNRLAVKDGFVYFSRAGDPKIYRVPE